MSTRLKAEAQRTGRSFKDVVNECLRRGLAQHSPARAPERFCVKPRDFGSVRPGVALDNIGELLQQIEGPDRA